MAEEPSPQSPTPPHQSPVDPPPPPSVPQPSVTKQVLGSRTIKTDKKPQPLLSRKKLKPPREIPSIPETVDPTTGPSRPTKSKRMVPLWLKAILRLIAYSVIVGLGVESYQVLRETRVHGALSVPGYDLPSQILIVRDFTDDLKVLHQEFSMARQPYLDEVKSKQDSLKRIQSDLAGLQERESLLQKEITNAKGEIATVISKSQADAAKIWDDNAKPMSDEHDKRLQALQNKILDRAKQLGLDFQIDSTVQSPEVWVNAFRLALYSPPKGVKTVDERIWAEDQLKEWTDFETAQEQRRQTLKGQVEEIHKSTGPKISEINDRVDHLQVRVAEAGEEVKPLREEMEMVTGQLSEAQERVEAQTKKILWSTISDPQKQW